MKKRKISPDDENDICKSYRKGVLTKELARKYDVSRITILNVLKRNKIAIKAIFPKNNNFKVTKEDECHICDEYVEGLSSVKLSNKYNLNPSTIIAILKRRGVQIRQSRKSHIFSTEEEKKICKEYEGGLSTYQLAKKYDSNHVTIYNILKRRGVSLRSRQKSD